MSKQINRSADQQIRLAIGIPTINQWTMLRNFLQLYLADFPGIRIYVWDNGNQGPDLYHPDIRYLGIRKNVGVAAAWNQLCTIIFSHGHSHAMILNDDIYLGSKLQYLLDLLSQVKKDFYKSLSDDWSVFIITKNAWQKTGRFDENFFPAYFEDRDYWHRMKLAGLVRCERPQLSAMITHNSLSSEKDPSLRDNFRINKSRYIAKWGGMPDEEKFIIPFNGQPDPAKRVPCTCDAGQYAMCEKNCNKQLVNSN